MKITLKILFALTIFCSIFTPMVYAAGPATPYIIDTDLNDDDAIAILYLLKNPTVVVKAISIENNESVHCSPAFRNTLGLMQLTGQNSIPVACGTERRASGTHQFPAWLLAKMDDMSGLAKHFAQPNLPLSHNAVQLLIDTIHHSPQPITILALGPLTNLAEAYKRDPSIKANIKMVYVMGGALNVPGNIRAVIPTSPNQKAEWNIFFDPTAAAIVLANLPITLVPLDVTNLAPLDNRFYEQVLHQRHTPAAEFVFQLVQNIKPYFNKHIWYFWDPLAAVVATNKEFFTFKKYPIRVETASGATVIDNQQGVRMTVCTAVDLSRFKNHLLATLNRTSTP